MDTLMDVGGHRLHFVVHRGTIPLTIVLEAGGGATLEDWKGIDAELANRTGATVVAYERAGFGRSELGPLEQHTSSGGVRHRMGLASLPYGENPYSNLRGSPTAFFAAVPDIRDP